MTTNGCMTQVTFPEKTQAFSSTFFPLRFIRFACDDVTRSRKVPQQVTLQTPVKVKDPEATRVREEHTQLLT